MGSPVPYPVTTPYGVPGSWAAGVHTGEDYACPIGTPVAATHGGTVLLAEWQGDYGLRVDIQADDSRQHSYSHLSAVSVVPGQRVTAGQVVGASGNTGRSTGPHLHYEERIPGYGYRDHARPIYSHEEAEPQPDPPEEDDMRPWAVNCGDRGWVVTDLATYWTGIQQKAVVDEGVSFGAYNLYAGGASVGPGWVDHIWSLRRVDQVPDS